MSRLVFCFVIPYIRHCGRRHPVFLGVGLEIETGNLQREEQFFQEENHVGGSNSANQVPTTKVVFEDDI